MAKSSNVAPPLIARLPVSFQAGAHVVRVTKVMQGRWTMAVDGGESAGSYATEADAWEAGVREADRIDRPPRSP
jgi:hypothetical protein